ncbi:MAG: hypothetical protein N2444_07350, partial [Methylocystis sp.]|nr:hypothetical protein [Methylocystis sp.]
MKIFLPRVANTALATVDDAPIGLFQRYNAAEAEFVARAEDADIVVLFEAWRSQFWDYAETLDADPFFRAHWRRLYTVNCDDHGRGFLPVSYTH